MIKKFLKFLKGFDYAFQGILSAFGERNMKIHGVVTLVVVVLAFQLGLTRIEWFLVMILIGLVWSAEMVNTSLEELASLVRDEMKLSYKATRRARDVAAGSVLVLAVVAAVVGVTLFGMKLGLF